MRSTGTLTWFKIQATPNNINYILKNENLCKFLSNEHRFFFCIKNCPTSMQKVYFLLFFPLLLMGCNPSPPDGNSPDQSIPLFTLLPAEETNIHFANTLTEGLNTNVLMYEYFYNGGGVAVGDLNGDGLDDIYFTANMISNKLYLNKGDLVFEDITDLAGVSGREGPWKTGVTMVDVNGDGLLDIYVCYSGNLLPEKRKDRKSTRLNSSHVKSSYAVFCLKKKNTQNR